MIMYMSFTDDVQMLMMMYKPIPICVECFWGVLAYIWCGAFLFLFLFVYFVCFVFFGGIFLRDENTILLLLLLLLLLLISCCCWCCCCRECYVFSLCVVWFATLTKSSKWWWNFGVTFAQNFTDNEIRRRSGERWKTWKQKSSSGAHPDELFQTAFLDEQFREEAAFDREASTTSNRFSEMTFVDEGLEADALSVDDDDHVGESSASPLNAVSFV